MGVEPQEHNAPVAVMADSDRGARTVRTGGNEEELCGVSVYRLQRRFTSVFDSVQRGGTTACLANRREQACRLSLATLLIGRDSD